jgi:hypothetical protein
MGANQPAARAREPHSLGFRRVAGFYPIACPFLHPGYHGTRDFCILGILLASISSESVCFRHGTGNGNHLLGWQGELRLPKGGFGDNHVGDIRTTTMKCRATLFLLSALLAWCPFSPAQQPEPAPVERLPAIEPGPNGTTLAALRNLMASKKAAEEERLRLKNELAKAVTAAEKEQLATKVEEKTRQRDEIRRDIETLATGVEPDGVNGAGTIPADLGAEFEDFVRPIIGELKALTAKPREIEALRSKVARQQRQIEQASRAIARLDELLAVASEQALATELRSIRQSRAEKLATAETDLKVSSLKLDEAEKNRDSIFTTAREAMAAFFRTRGRNFLTAVLAFATVWFSIRLLYRKLLKASPFLRRRDRSFSARLVDVAVQAFALVAAIFATLLVLYAASDWVLLGLTLLFLTGLGWASKQAIPLFFEQAKLMLNLGSVREGERINHNGVPWEVKRINVFTELVNPVLTGGHLRMPIRDLIPLVSRPFESKEMWFPTAEGDWVILSDGTYGRVIQQTPEWVQVIQLGGARKNYATRDFLGQNPLNLSSNFRVSTVFGIDYLHQPIATTAVPGVFRARLEEGLASLVSAEEILNIAVEFKHAGSSSLDYAILADFAGSAAPKYQKIDRLIARICVDVCNENGWRIPFTQITLHQAAVVPEQG